MKFALHLFLICLCFILIACGRKSSGAGVVRENLPLEPEGIFSATIHPVNQNLSKKLKGAITITKYGDYFNVRIKLQNAPTSVHMQGLYAGDTCPNEDSNGDGYVDANEAKKNIQHMLIPFDDDLSGWEAGNNIFPVNSYTYERSTSFALMRSDLNKKDRNLQLEGKVVVIHGVSVTDSLPDPLSVPIGCGILTHASYEPDEPNEEPETSPVRVRPRDEPDYEPEVEYPEPEVERPRGFWGRWGDRLERWWNRLGGWRRGEDDEKP